MTETDTSFTGNIEIPKNMHLSEESDKLELEYSWFSPKYIFSLIAAPPFTYFLVGSEYINGDFDELTPSVLLLAGFALFTVYFSLAKLLNTTKIQVRNQEIRLNHGPLPMTKNLILKKKDVKQLYLTQHRIRHRYYLYATTYQINVILENKNAVTLIKGLSKPEQGRFIESKIEAFLNITDVNVEGELPKK